MNAKNEIRIYLKKLLSDMTSDQRIAESRRILCNLELNEKFLSAKVIMLYFSLPDEVCTHSFIQKWSRSKTILLPDVKNNEICLKKFTSLDDMEESEFHIIVPQESSYINPGAIDLIIVPGMAFTRDGKRLGRGRGYYDRFLSRIDTRNIYRIGTAFPCQLMDNLPVESHDVLMDEVYW